MKSLYLFLVLCLGGCGPDSALEGHVYEVGDQVLVSGVHGIIRRGGKDCLDIDIHKAWLTCVDKRLVEPYEYAKAVKDPKP